MSRWSEQTTRGPTWGVEKPCDIFADANRCNTCESAGEPLTVKLTGWAKEAAQSDPHLAAVLATWATLAEPVKANIVAIITAHPR